MTGFHVLTLFPEFIMQYCRNSALGRAVMRGIAGVVAIDIRDYADENRKRRIDDYTYGGGAGMLMQPGPVVRAYQSLDGLLSENRRVIYVTPKGNTFSDAMAREMSTADDIVLICGHYEGIDERALEIIGPERVSIGDYVLTGGELPALVIMDAISRWIPGVLNNDESAHTDTFCDGLLEYPQYTRPDEFGGLCVPEILKSGNHDAIRKWRRLQSLLITRRERPDLFARLELTKEDIELLAEHEKSDGNI